MIRRHSLVIHGKNVILSIGTKRENGELQSELKREICIFCSQPDCNHTCHCSKIPSDEQTDDDISFRLRYNAMLDTIESLILSHAFAGVDVSDPRYIAGVKDTLEALGSNF